MNHKNKDNPKKEPKEFSASDVIRMHNSVDEANGIGIDTIIKINQTNRKIVAKINKRDG